MKSLSLLLVLLIFSSLLQAGEISARTQKLNGIDISYNYTSGRSYNVKFEQQGISYRYLTGSKPEVWWGPFPYQAFEVEKDVYFVSWFEVDYADYVTLLVNFKTKLLYGSALLAGKTVHFHGANIVKINAK